MAAERPFQNLRFPFLSLLVVFLNGSLSAHGNRVNTLPSKEVLPKMQVTHGTFSAKRDNLETDVEYEDKRKIGFLGRENQSIAFKFGQKQVDVAYGKQDGFLRNYLNNVTQKISNRGDLLKVDYQFMEHRFEVWRGRRVLIAKGETPKTRSTRAVRKRMKAKKKRRKAAKSVLRRTRVPRLYDPVEAVSSTAMWQTVWMPRPNCFLLAYCQYGQASNRVYCLLNAVKYAALLNRTLVVEIFRDRTNRFYDQHLIFDLHHVRLCYGNSTVLTTTEYQELYGKNVVINQVLCANARACRWNVLHYGNPNVACASDDMCRLQSAAVNATNEAPVGLRMGQLRNLAGNAAEGFLYMGDFYHNPLLTKFRYSLKAARSGGCFSNIAVIPNSRVLEVGGKFLETVFEGRQFMSVHLRRGDFRIRCGRIGCHPPIKLVVRCLREKVVLFNVSTVFLATNAEGDEKRYLIRHLSSGKDRDLRIVQVNAEELKNRGWDTPLVNATDEYSKLFLATLDKVIAMRAAVFVGTWWSSFTRDIERLRYGFGTADPRDTFLCEKPALSSSVFQNFSNFRSSGGI